MSVIEVRAAAICVLHDRVLLLNHQKENRSYWVLPGGHVEPGETLPEAVARELKEEVDLDVTVGPLALVHDFITEKRHVVNHVFLATAASDALCVDAGETLKDARWVLIGELDGIDLLPPITEHIRRVVTQPPSTPVYLGSI